MSTPQVARPAAGDHPEELDLAGWRRRVWALYEPVRRLGPAADVAAQAATLSAFRAGRDALFRDHPQTPLPRDTHGAFAGLACYPLDPALRFVCDLVPDRGTEPAALPTSHASALRFRAIGHVQLELPEGPARLTVYWLADYAGGIFLPFRDATSGTETYAAGRYLWDSAKGADLGVHGGRIVVDFNYAYNPSCAYDARWACPLAPPENRISTPIRAGEMAFAAQPASAGSEWRGTMGRARGSLARGGP